MYHTLLLLFCYMDSIEHNINKFLKSDNKKCLICIIENYVFFTKTKMLSYLSAICNI